MRIYVVKGANTGQALHLVKAKSRAQALRYAASKGYTVDLASQDDLVELVSEGYKVEDGTKDPDQGALDLGDAA